MDNIQKGIYSELLDFSIQSTYNLYLLYENMLFKNKYLNDKIKRRLLEKILMDKLFQIKVLQQIKFMLFFKLDTLDIQDTEVIHDFNLIKYNELEMCKQYKIIYNNSGDYAVGKMMLDIIFSQEQVITKLNLMTNNT